MVYMYIWFIYIQTSERIYVAWTSIPPPPKKRKTKYNYLKLKIRTTRHTKPSEKTDSIQISLKLYDVYSEIKDDPHIKSECS